MRIQFAKAHGAKNDFLLTLADDLPGAVTASLARAICDRHTGIGADGWLIVKLEVEGADCGIDLWNSDGSTSPISGNGTRCAAALWFQSKPATESVRIRTGAGVKELRLIEKSGRKYSFEMNMGPARIEDLRATVQGRDAVILDVGNPQCAIFVDNFDFDWAAAGAIIESDPRFPLRTNVSFVRVLDRQTLDVRFFERGAGVTMSSGTGSTGAAAAAVARNLCDQPVTLQTPAGPLKLRWQNDEILLTGPAEIVGTGEFYMEDK
jgi:diaminopimelate epimerase